MEIVTLAVAVLGTLGICSFFALAPVPKRFQKKELSEVKSEFNFEKKTPELYLWSIESEPKTFTEWHEQRCTCPKCKSHLEAEKRSARYHKDYRHRSAAIPHQVTI